MLSVVRESLPLLLLMHGRIEEIPALHSFQGRP